MSDKQKAVLLHAAYSVGAVAAAAASAFVLTHWVDLFGRHYEVLASAVLIPLLEAARKWFTTKEGV